MAVTIENIRVICTAPEGINLLAVRVDTNVPGLYGLGCGTFSYRHLAVKLVVEEMCIRDRDRGYTQGIHPHCFF